MKTWQSVLADIERARTPRGRGRIGRVSLEGTRLVERALRAGIEIDGTLHGTTFGETSGGRERRLLDALADRGVAMWVVPDEVLARSTDGRRLGAILALAVPPPARSLSEALARSPLVPPILLATAGVSDPGNTGALLRTAHACGSAALLSLPPTDAWHPRAIRTSMGSVFKLPWIPYPGTDRLLRDLRSAAVRTLVAVPSGGVPLDDCELGNDPWCVLLGGEAHGPPPSVVAAAELRVTIPMVDGVDSLSANAAAAVLLHTVARSRRVARAGSLP